MNDYDKAGRYLVKRQPARFFRWLFSHPAVTFHARTDARRVDLPYSFSSWIESCHFRPQTVLTKGHRSVSVRRYNTRKEHIMSKIRCESIADGLRASEALAIFRDYQGRKHYLRVERDYLSQENGVYFLPVGVVHVDPRTSLVLIELPHEAETGANRLWVNQDQLDEPIEAYA
jgi:hypothetical protein